MAKLLEYRGYHAKVEYDPEDNLLVGKILGISDSLYFHAKNTTDIIVEFHNSVDNYLEVCARFGKKPDKEYSGTFNVRVSSELHKRASVRAQEDNTTLNKVVEKALEAYLATETVLINRFANWMEVFTESVKMLSVPISITAKSTAISTSTVTKAYPTKQTTLIPFPANSYNSRRKIVQQ